MRKTLVTVTMALVLGSSTVFANGGIIIAGRNATTKSMTKADPCTAQKDGIIIAGRDGIIIAGRGTMFGAIFGALAGILVSDRGTCTAEKDGIIIAGRDGILVSD